MMNQYLGPPPSGPPPPDALPQGWAAHWSEEHGQVYYTNSITGETTWTKPIVASAQTFPPPPPPPSVSPMNPQYQSNVQRKPVSGLAAHVQNQNQTSHSPNPQYATPFTPPYSPPQQQVGGNGSGYFPPPPENQYPPPPARSTSPYAPGLPPRNYQAHAQSDPRGSFSGPSPQPQMQQQFSPPPTPGSGYQPTQQRQFNGPPGNSQYQPQYGNGGNGQNHYQPPPQGNQRSSFYGPPPSGNQNYFPPPPQNHNQNQNQSQQGGYYPPQPTQHQLQNPHSHAYTPPLTPATPNTWQQQQQHQNQNPNSKPQYPFPPSQNPQHQSQTHQKKPGMMGKLNNQFKSLTSTVGPNSTASPLKKWGTRAALGIGAIGALALGVDGMDGSLFDGAAAAGGGFDGSMFGGDAVGASGLDGMGGVSDISGVADAQSMVDANAVQLALEQQGQENALMLLDPPGTEYTLVNGGAVSGPMGLI